MISNTSVNKRIFVATIALMISICSAQNAYIVFRNPDVNADANVISDISQIVDPESINAVRNAVIGAIEQKAEQVIDKAQSVINSAAAASANSNSNANIGANVRARRLQQASAGLGGLGGLLALPLSLLNLPLSLVGGLLGGK